MVQDVVGNQTLEGMVEALTELIAGAFGTSSKLRLFKDTFSPTPNNVEADFIAAEADFVGYVAGTLTYGPVGLDAAGEAVSYSSRVEFQATDATTPNSIGGIWIDSQTSAGPPAVVTSLRYFQFQTPIPMASALATMGVVAVAKAPNLVGKCIVDN